MRILLVVVHSVSCSIFPQGIAYVAAALKAAGHEVFGVNINNFPTPASAADLLFNQLQLAKDRWQPEAMAVGGLSGDYPFVKRTIQFWRQLSPHTPIIIGGGIVTADPDFIFRDLHPDFVIRGEAEIPIVKLVDALQTGKDFVGIDGLIYWRDGVPVFNAEACRTKEMPDYPYPYYDAFDIERFYEMASGRQTRAFTGSATKPRLFPVSAARSCPFKCTFCFHSSGVLYRQRPIDDVIKEIEFFYDKYHFTMLTIYDELFSISEKRISEFCEKLKKTGIGIEWGCALRVTNVNSNLLRLMKDAGCIIVGYGLESASDTVLASMKKKIKKADILRALRITEESGIAFQGNFIFGDPAETPQTIDETMDFFRKHCQDHSVELGLIRPYPGAQIFQGLLDRKIITNKSDYYERIGKTNYDVTANYNMTAMPDDVFWQVINDKVIGKNKRRNTSALDMQVLTKNDNLDWNMRTDVLLKAICPHCGSEFEKTYDIYFDPTKIDGWKAIEGDAFHLCMECKKVSNILVSPLIMAKQEIYDNGPFRLGDQETTAPTNAPGRALSLLRVIKRCFDNFRHKE